MRCNSCSKFVSFDTDVDPEINEDGVVDVQVRIANNCAECGQELTQADLQFQIDLSDQVEEHREGCEECKAHPELEVTDSSATRTERAQTHTPQGKPIKNPRYRKHFYGAEVEVTVTAKGAES